MREPLFVHAAHRIERRHIDLAGEGRAAMPKIRLFRLIEGKQRHMGDYDFEHVPGGGSFVSVKSGEGRLTLNVMTVVHICDPDEDEPAIQLVVETATDRLINRSMM